MVGLNCKIVHGFLAVGPFKKWHFPENALSNGDHPLFTGNFYTLWSFPGYQYSGTIKIDFTRCQNISRDEMHPIVTEEIIQSNSAPIDRNTTSLAEIIRYRNEPPIIGIRA
ncbi:hypothetical protein BPOR_0082g00060 [Botrytis porri]|uniref:Uncharacterized protein n=1 Tax=Botrytis porri TaxID=87229 RepID=A0A4Z1L003_9HELO|nr:hypothetical protein BPOR_0082g00060 [Botrytis porri]